MFERQALHYALLILLLGLAVCEVAELQAVGQPRGVAPTRRGWTMGVGQPRGIGPTGRGAEPRRIYGQQVGRPPRWLLALPGLDQGLGEWLWHGPQAGPRQQGSQQGAGEQAPAAHHQHQRDAGALCQGCPQDRPAKQD
jgi:hypothetical protein